MTVNFEPLPLGPSPHKTHSQVSTSKVGRFQKAVTVPLLLL